MHSGNVSFVLSSLSKLSAQRRIPHISYFDYKEIAKLSLDSRQEVNIPRKTVKCLIVTINLFIIIIIILINVIIINNYHVLLFFFFFFSKMRAKLKIAQTRLLGALSTVTFRCLHLSDIA